MLVAQYDKAMVKYFVDPNTGKYLNAQNDLQAPLGGIAMVLTEAEFRTRFLNKEYKIIGEKMEPTTKTVAEAFSKIPDEAALQQALEKASQNDSHSTVTPIRATIPSRHAKATDVWTGDALMSFTRALIDFNKAKGREKLIKKAFCNGLARGITSMCPDLEDKLKRMVVESKDKDFVDGDDSFI